MFSLEIIGILLVAAAGSFASSLPVYVIYRLILRLRRIKRGVLHWIDIPGILIPYPLWIILEQLHWSVSGKSLGNLVELLLIGWIWTLFFLVRCLICLFCKEANPKRYAWYSTIAIIIITLLIEILVPWLPE